MTGIKAKRGRQLKQQDVPSYTLKDTLRLPKAIADELAKEPSPPLYVASAMGIQPTTGQFRSIASASIAYGLTEGSAWAERIALTPLGARAVSPTEEGDDLRAMKEAVMRPRVVREFLTKYSGNKWPRDDIGKNVLVDMGVPKEQAARALGLIHTNAMDLGLIVQISGAEYVSLESEVKESNALPTQAFTETTIVDSQEVESQDVSSQDNEKKLITNNSNSNPRKVFIAHGKNKKILNQIKIMLQLGELVPVIAEEQETAAKPVPQKVREQMRSCGSAVISVTADGDYKNEDGSYNVNQNVLIEIGAAFVLYDEKVILVWDKRVKVPSNLQGLYRCEYEGNELTWEAGTRLQKALLSIKKGDKPS